MNCAEHGTRLISFPASGFPSWRQKRIFKIGVCIRSGLASEVNSIYSGKLPRIIKKSSCSLARLSGSSSCSSRAATFG